MGELEAGSTLGSTLQGASSKRVLHFWGSFDLFDAVVTALCDDSNARFVTPDAESVDCPICLRIMGIDAKAAMLRDRCG